MDTDYQDRHWNTDQKEDGTLDDRRRDGGTNSTLRTKEQGTHLTLNEHDDDGELKNITMLKPAMSRTPTRQDELISCRCSVNATKDTNLISLLHLQFTNMGSHRLFVLPCFRNLWRLKGVGGLQSANTCRSVLLCWLCEFKGKRVYLSLFCY